jgi:hypothetical protein
MASTRSTLAWVGLLAAALGAAAAWPEATTTPAAAEPAAAAPAVDTAAAARASTAEAPRITFPDGSSLPVLNGVDEPIALDWPADTPYSPVVATVNDQGFDWFKHADGSWSTTMRRLDSATGKYVNLATLFQPAPAGSTQMRGQSMQPTQSKDQ